MSMLSCSNIDVASSGRAGNAFTAMMVVSWKSCGDAARTVARLHVPVMSLMMAMMAGSVCAHAGAVEAGQRFQLSGYGTISANPPPQKSMDFQLKAYLTPKDAAIAALPPLQEGGGFALIARATTPALVCYNDTIFRNDYDGDGR